jgi:hypothetical protein
VETHSQGVCMAGGRINSRRPRIPVPFAANARDFGFAVDGDDVGISSEELLD